MRALFPLAPAQALIEPERSDSRFFAKGGTPSNGFVLQGVPAFRARRKRVFFHDFQLLAARTDLVFPDHVSTGLPHEVRELPPAAKFCEQAEAALAAHEFFECTVEYRRP